MKAILLASFLLSVSPVALAGQSQQDMLNMLDQLDQLDELDEADFNDAIQAAYDCFDRQDFKCGDKKVAEAKKLAFDEKSKSVLEEVAAYRQKAKKFAEEKRHQQELAELQKRCADSCRVASEYQRCMQERLSPRNCSDPNAYKPMSKLQWANMAIQGLQQASDEYLQQRRQMLQQQQQIQAQVRQENQRQQQIIARQKQEWQREQDRQQAALAQQQKDLVAMREANRLAREEAQKRAEQQAQLEADRQQRAAEEEQRRQQRLAEIEAKKQARLKEQAEKKARKAAYLAQLKAGAKMWGFDMDGKNVKGNLPNIKPVEVDCVDVHFDVYCPGSQSPDFSGVFHNMVSDSADSMEVPSDLVCKAKDFRVVATEVVGCP